MARYFSSRSFVRLRLLKQVWHSRLLAVVITTGITFVAGFVLNQAFPRGPATALQALMFMGIGLCVGWLAGFLMRSRWAMLIVPAAYMLAVEISQLNRIGPTVGPIRLDESFGILALLVGRGFHGVVGILPMLAGIGLGMMTAIACDTAPAHTLALNADLNGDLKSGQKFNQKWRTFTVVLTIALVILAGIVLIPARTPAILTDSGNVLPGSIASLEKVQIGGYSQSIMLRGYDQNSPVLLYLSGGPGQSDLSYSRVFFEDLTRDFVVVSWDERGTGKSYASLDPTETLTLDQAIANTAELTRYLQNRFDEDKIYLMGESWGSLLGILTVQRHPDLFYAFIGSGQMVNVQESDRRIYQALLQKATQSGDQPLLRKLRQYGEPPYKDIPYANGFIMGQYSKLEKPYTPPQAFIKKGTTSSLGPWNIFGSEYNLVENVNILRGLLDVFTVLYPQIQAIDLRQSAQQLDVPIYILDGAAEIPARRDLLLEWYDQLEAPRKEIFTFKDAAHSVAFEQFEALHRILIETILPQTYSQSSRVLQFSLC